MKILVVDDIGYSRHNLSRAIERHGHDVVQAEDGAAALKVLRQDQTIDAVITDLIMGDIDGVELYIRALKLERVNDEGNAGLPPFVLLTSAQPGRPGSTNAESARIDLARELGFADVLFKPVNPQMIHDVLETLQSGRTKPTVQIVPLIVHLKDVVQQLVREDNVEEAEKLNSCLKEQSGLLDQIGQPANA
jgi:CheY-like chemotaxis protein